MPPTNKSPLARLIDDSPLRSKFIAQQLGYTDGTWGQIRMGHRRLVEHKVALLASLLDLEVGKLRRICDQTYNLAHKE